MRYSQKYIDGLKEKIPQAAFRLFSEHGIESVSMQNIADASQCGVASLYRYYGSKVNLVIEVCSAQFRALAKDVVQLYEELGGEEFTAYQEMEFYMDCYISLYRKNPAMLKFISNFDLYILQEKPTKEEMASYFEAAGFYSEFFHERYSKAFRDHTIRTDLPEMDVYFGIMHSMLSASEKFACGTLWDFEMDYAAVLEMQKRAYLNYLVQGIGS